MNSPINVALKPADWLILFSSDTLLFTKFISPVSRGILETLADTGFPVATITLKGYAGRAKKELCSRTGLRENAFPITHNDIDKDDPGALEAVIERSTTPYCVCVVDREHPHVLSKSVNLGMATIAVDNRLDPWLSEGSKRVLEYKFWDYSEPKVAVTRTHSPERALLKLISEISGVPVQLPKTTRAKRSSSGYLLKT